MTAVAPARDAVTAATDSLRAAGCETPRLDAEVLVAAAIGVSRLDLVSDPDVSLDGAAARTVMGWVRRRAQREPVAYIVGRKEFRRIELVVDRRVLIPRPETELLVEVAVELAPSGGHVHDVGTGSGCVALALKDERPDLTVTASDRSPAALEVARLNAERLGLEIGFEPLTDCDLVVANLPYVRKDDWAGLEPELREYEPREALLADADGLEEIRALIASASAGSLLALEHAPDQAKSVREMLADASTRRDLAGRDRVTIGRSMPYPRHGGTNSSMDE